MHSSLALRSCYTLKGVWLSANCLEVNLPLLNKMDVLVLGYDFAITISDVYQGGLPGWH